jgi:hypothetical protein
MTRVENDNTLIMTVNRVFPPIGRSKKGQIVDATGTVMVEVWARDFPHFKIGETYLITFEDWVAFSGAVHRTAVRAEVLDPC